MITHSGSFHYDELLATAMLLIIYVDYELIRTRDEEIIATGDIVYDVGGIINPKLNRYDHHMRTFNETFAEGYKFKLSSSGLIYKYFCVELFEKFGFSKNDPLFDYIYKKIYDEFFMWADVVDNGYDDIFSGFSVRKISDLVQEFNLPPNKLGNIKKENEQFKKAFEIVRVDLENYLKRIFTIYVPNYTLAKKDLLRANIDKVYYNSENYPREIITDIDKEIGLGLYYTITKKNGNFCVYALSKENKCFEPKLRLKEEWRGLRDEELVKVSGFSDIIFVHATGFLGVSKSLETARMMCKITINEETSSIKGESKINLTSSHQRRNQN